MDESLGGERVTPVLYHRIHFLGRRDQQIKIRGHRVETEEVEHVIREITGAEFVAVVAWPLTAEGAAGLVAFSSPCSADPVQVLRQCAEALPDYMVPRDLRTIEVIPTGATGNVDRRGLVALLASE